MEREGGVKGSQEVEGGESPTPSHSVDWREGGRRVMQKEMKGECKRKEGRKNMGHEGGRVTGEGIKEREYSRRKGRRRSKEKGYQRREGKEVGEGKVLV